MRLLLPALVILGIIAAVLLAQQGLGGGAAGTSRVLSGDPDGARSIQDVRPPAPPSPRREAWRWTLTILGILAVSAAVVLGIVLIARAVWQM